MKVKFVWFESNIQKEMECEALRVRIEPTVDHTILRVVLAAPSGEMHYWLITLFSYIKYEDGNIRIGLDGGPVFRE